MVTNNFKKWQRANFVNARPVLIDETGEEVTVQQVTSSYGTPHFTNGANAVGIKMVIGLGDDTPEADDYKLASLSEQFSYSSISAVVTTEGEKTVLVFTMTAQNTSADNVEVKEVGLFKSLNRSSTVSNYYLMAREVFGAPVTVGPGESVAVSMAIKY